MEVIPSYLLEPCDLSSFKGATWAELAEYTIKLMGEANRCKDRHELLSTLINQRVKQLLEERQPLTQPKD